MLTNRQTDTDSTENIHLSLLCYAGR